MKEGRKTSFYIKLNITQTCHSNSHQEFPEGPSGHRPWNTPQNQHLIISHLQEPGEHLKDRNDSNRWEWWVALSELWVSGTAPADPLNYTVPSNLGSPQLALRSVLGRQTQQLVSSSRLSRCIHMDTRYWLRCVKRPWEDCLGQWLRLGALWVSVSFHQPSTACTGVTNRREVFTVLIPKTCPSRIFHQTSVNWFLSQSNNFQDFEKYPSTPGQ